MRRDSEHKPITTSFLDVVTARDLTEPNKGIERAIARQKRLHNQTDEKIVSQKHTAGNRNPMRREP